MSDCDVLAGLEQATQLAFMFRILSPTLPRSCKSLLQSRRNNTIHGYSTGFDRVVIVSVTPLPAANREAIIQKNVVIFSFTGVQS